MSKWVFGLYQEEKWQGVLQGNGRRLERICLETTENQLVKTK